MNTSLAAGVTVEAIGINPFTPLKDAVTGAADDFLDSIGSAFCNMAADLSSSVFSFAAQKTAIDLQADYVIKNYNIVFGVAVLVVTGLFIVSAIIGAVRGDPHVLVRAVATTGTAILGSFVALTLLQMMLAASDGLSDAFGDGQPLGASLVSQLRALPQQGNFALDMVLSLLVALFAFALFVVLYIRKVVIIAVAVFIPLFLAGQPTVSTSAWMKRAAELLVALILAKPVIYAIFTLGAGMATDNTGSATDQTLTILGGVVVMIAAVFSPFALLQLFGFADVHLMRSVGQMGRRGAATFGQGAGALLGSTSRETFKGIGARLQTRNRGVLGDSVTGGSAIAVGGGGRPAIRAGRPGMVPATARAPRPVTAGRPSIGAGTGTVSGRSASPVPARVPTRVGGGARATTAPALTSSPRAATATPRPATAPSVRPRVPGSTGERSI